MGHIRDSLGNEWKEMDLSVGGLGCKGGARPEGLCGLCCDWSRSFRSPVGDDAVWRRWEKRPFGGIATIPDEM